MRCLQMTYLELWRALALELYPAYVSLNKRIKRMSLPANIQDMIDDFAFLTDWEDRYTHVIDMGRNLAPLLPSEKIEANKVKGCVSQVWLVTEQDDDKVLKFRGDSDAHIVKGLVAVVLQIYDGRTPPEALSLEPTSILSQLGLSEHLSPQRSNGLNAMIKRIRAIAAAAA